MLKVRYLIWLLIIVTLPLKAQTIAEKVQLGVWANEAIVSTYTYNYQNFLNRQKEIAKYFTANGWIAYNKALTDSKLPEAIKTNNYYVSAVATQPPAIKKIGENKWQAIMPVLVMYKNPRYHQTQNLQVKINFTKVASDQGVRSLAITSLQSEVKTPLCKCEDN